MDRPGVGTGVWIRKDGKILFGLRSGKTGAGTWCPPSGKLEMNEEWEECARRETLEETGIEIQNLKLITVVNDIAKEAGTHFVTLHFVCDWKSGDVQLTEPDKFTEWRWFDWNDLPEPLFWSARNFIKNGYNPFTI